MLGHARLYSKFKMLLLSGRLPSPFPPGLRKPRYFAAPQTRPGDTIKNPDWLVWRTEQTASPCAANLGMSPYANGDPHTRWQIMCGFVNDEFTGNDATKYGELHEPRLRAIARRVLGPEISIEEYGLFRDAVFDWIGISPDGITNAIRLEGLQPYYDDQEQEWKLHEFDLTVGKIMYEAKCSPNNEYKHPQVSHLFQIHSQMRVAQRGATILHYWSRDRTRMFFIPFSPQFWAWMEPRMILMHEHVKRRVPLFKLDVMGQPIQGSNPFFNWLTNTEKGPKAYGNKLGDYCKDMWFWKSKHKFHGRQLRAPLALADWDAALERLGMTHEDYVATPGYADSAPQITIDGETGARTMQPGCLAMNMVPPRPQMYEIFRYTRNVPASELKAGDPPYVKPVDETELAFFEREYPPIANYYEEQTDYFHKFNVNAARGNNRAGLPWACDKEDADLIMDRLFVRRITNMPELDEPEPVDTSTIFASEDERLEYERRLVIQMEKYNRLKKEEAERLATEQRANAQAEMLRLYLQPGRAGTSAPALAAAIDHDVPDDFWTPEPEPVIEPVAAATETPGTKRRAAAEKAPRKRAQPPKKRASPEWQDSGPAPINVASLSIPLIPSERHAVWARIAGVRLVDAVHEDAHMAVVGIDTTDAFVCSSVGPAAELERNATIWPIFALCVAAVDAPTKFPGVPRNIVQPDAYRLVTARRRSDQRAISIYYCIAQFDMIQHVASMPWVASITWVDEQD